METEWQRIPADPESIKSLINSLNCHPVTATVLANRAILTKQDALKFLNPSFSQIRAPFSLKDMEIAVDRIVSAIENKEKIKAIQYIAIFLYLLASMNIKTSFLKIKKIFVFKIST